MKTDPFLIVLLVLSLHVAGFAQSATDNVEVLLRREMVERRIPGLQIAVVRQGKIVLSKSFGTADIQHSVPVTSKTVFPIFSCTKAFTGVALMQLVEEGKLELAAPVSRYLDGLPPSWQPITIRQLLTHVSGLPNILNPSRSRDVRTPTRNQRRRTLDQAEIDAHALSTRRAIQLQPN